MFLCSTESLKSYIYTQGSDPSKMAFCELSLTRFAPRITIDLSYIEHALATFSLWLFGCIVGYETR